jgi:hypothetical protein
MKMSWKRLGAGLGGALLGAALGAVMGFAEAYAVLVACSGFLGFGDQDGLIILAVAPFGAIHGGIVGLLVGLGVRNVGGWVLGALVGLGFWAPLFLWAAHHHSNVILLVAVSMPLWCGGIGAVLQNCLTNQRERPPQEPPEEGSRTEDPPANRTQLQIAGSKCKACERTIILSNEGKFCARCGTAVHRSCEPRATCDACDEPYHAYEHA